MKTRNAILAMLFLIVLGASSCATLSAPVPVTEEQEEEIGAGKTNMEMPWRDLGEY